MTCWLRGHWWELITYMAGCHLWGCRRCGRVKIQIFRPPGRPVPRPAKLPPLAAYLTRLRGKRSIYQVVEAVRPHGVGRNAVYKLFRGETTDPNLSTIRAVLVHGLGRPDPLPELAEAL